MLVAIDGRMANTRAQLGAQVYCTELLRVLPAVCPDIDLRVYLDRPPLESFPLTAAQMDLRILPSGTLWTLWRLGLALRQDPPDVFWAPALQIPLFDSCPMAATHHGLSYIAQPECFSRRQRLDGRIRTAWALRRAGRIFAVSEYMKQEMVQFCGADPERITVVYHGVPPGFSGEQPPGEQARVREKYALSGPYILVSGRLSPRKNTARIVHAYELFRQRNPALEHLLVLAGGDDWGAEEIRRQIADSPFHDAIRVTGQVGRQDMPALTAAADLSMLVSLWESFGIPIIEAMSAGIPVITSNHTAMREVAGEAALLVDPCDVEAIAAAIQEAICNPNTRKDLIARGNARVRSFTWENAARKTFDALGALAQHSPRPGRRLHP